MNYRKTQLAAGLYFVGTPIGTARDITLRALDTLASADVLAAEDTRSLRKLMDIHGIPLDGRRVIAYHDHSSKAAADKLIQEIKAGKSVAYASEAGMPMIADPGYELSRDAAEAGLLVTSAPGPTAMTTAIALAGLPSDAIFFAGFLPSAAAARKKKLREFAHTQATVVFYESPKRVAACLRDMETVFGSERRAVLARELTKKFEDIRRDTLANLVHSVEVSPPKGEIVLLVDRAPEGFVNEFDLDKAILDALSQYSVRDASDRVSQASGIKRRIVYQRALALAKEREQGGNGETAKG